MTEIVLKVRSLKKSKTKKEAHTKIKQHPISFSVFADWLCWGTLTLSIVLLLSLRIYPRWNLRVFLGLWACMLPRVCTQFSIYRKIWVLLDDLIFQILSSSFIFWALGSLFYVSTIIFCPMHLWVASSSCRIFWQCSHFFPKFQVRQNNDEHLSVGPQ